MIYSYNYGILKKEEINSLEYLVLKSVEFYSSREQTGEELQIYCISSTINTNRRYSNQGRFSIILKKEWQIAWINQRKNIKSRKENELISK